MEDHEIAGVLAELESILDRLGYSALVEQERRAAAAGRVVETTKEDRARSRGRRGSRPEVGDVRRTPLTAAERLAMLIDLVEAAVGGTFAIEERVLDFAYSNFPAAATEGRMPTFRPDVAEGFAVEDDRQWTLPDRPDLDTRRQTVREVLADLDQLRDVAGLDRDPVLIPESRGEADASQRILGWA